jgi:hypothetical protein
VEQLALLPYWSYPQLLEGLQGTITLAYLASSSATKKKVFQLCHVIKLFSLSQMMKPNTLEHLTLASLS